MNFAVVIPSFNEEKHIKEVITRTKKYSNNIIVVDDASKDRTEDIASAQKVVVLHHIVNLGKGAALKTGVDFAFRNGADKVVLLDGDLQHSPEEIPHFLKALENHDIVFGYRRQNKKHMPIVFKLGNWFIERATRLLFHVKILDTQCGFRAFTRQAYNKIRWESNDYSVESEMIALTGKNKLRYTQIPIETIYHNRYKGTTVFDGIKIVKNMIWWRMTR